MIIRVSSRFKKEYKKLPRNVQEMAEEKEILFRENPFNERLETHKLHGKYKNYWAFTIIGQYRILFMFSGSRTADFINIGTHDIYK